MKKKILLVLLVVVLALTMTAGLVACKKNNSTPADNDKKEETPVTPEDKDGLINDDVAFVLGEVIASAKDITGDLGKASDSYYADVTLFGDVNGTAFDLRAAATLDAKKLTNNKALVDVNVGKDDIVTLYIANDTLYVGEALMQEEFSWVKFDQVEEDGLVSYMASLLPEKISDVFAGLDITQYTSMVDGFLPVIASLGMFELSTPDAYSADAETLADGTYTFNIKMSELSGLLDILKTPGIDLRAILSSLQAPLDTIVNTAVEVVFGGSIDDVLDGKVKEYPEIALSFDFNNGDLSGLALSYASKSLKLEGNDLGAIDLTVGVKDLVISKDSTADIAPDVKLSTIERAAVQANIAVKAPSFVVGAEGETLDLNLDAYVYPSVKIGFENKDGFNISGFYFDINTASAVVIAKNDGTPIAAADYIGANKEFRIDVADLFNFVGMSINNNKFTGYFDLEKAITGKDDFYYEAENAEKKVSDNPIDAIYATVKDFIDNISDFEIGSIFDIVGDISGNVTTIVDDLKASEIFTVNAEDLSFSISVNDLAKYIVDEDGIIATSSAIKDNLPIDLADYANVEDLVSLIAGATQVSEDTVYGYIKKVTGEQTDYDEYIQNCTIVFKAIRGEKDGDGVGFSVAIVDKSGKEVVSVEVKLDIVGADNAQDSGIATGFQGIEWYDQDGVKESLSTFGSDMMSVLKGFFQDK